MNTHTHTHIGHTYRLKIPCFSLNCRIDYSENQDMSQDLLDVLKQCLDKDPATRITMQSLRQHPWVTQHGTDLLISEEENCEMVVTEVTADDIHNAIKSIASILTVVSRGCQWKKRWAITVVFLFLSLGQSRRQVQTPFSILIATIPEQDHNAYTHECCHRRRKGARSTELTCGSHFVFIPAITHSCLDSVPCIRPFSIICLI